MCTDLFQDEVIIAIVIVTGDGREERDTEEESQRQVNGPLHRNNCTCDPSGSGHRK